MSSVQYVPFDGERVSRQWAVVLTDMREAGVIFRVNEGHRTWARQAHFYALYRSGRGNLAAKPSRNAPHIRTGRIDHALDVQNADLVVAWLLDAGISVTRPVPGEDWHVEASAEDLRRYARSQLDPVIQPHYVRPFQRNDRDAVRRLQTLIRRRGFTSVLLTGRYDRATRSAVRRIQQSNGLRVDGIVGPATWRALRK